MLRDVGADGLSLRELARHAGVSHGAPRSHFIDRQALLNALAERGFHRLADKIRSALTSPGSFEERFRLVGRAYVDFAVDDAALMALMFAVKTSDTPGTVQEAAVHLFRVLDEAIGAPAVDVAGSDARDRFKLLFAATMQGTAALIVARRITRTQGEVIVDDATSILLRSELGVGVLFPR